MLGNSNRRRAGSLHKRLLRGNQKKPLPILVLINAFVLSLSGHCEGVIEEIPRLGSQNGRESVSFKRYV